MIESESKHFVVVVVVEESSSLKKIEAVRRTTRIMQEKKTSMSRVVSITNFLTEYRADDDYLQNFTPPERHLQ
jgi:hypothetical protein